MDGLGKAMALSGPRRVVCDLMEASAAIPLIPIQRDIDVSALVAARASLPSQPSWCAIFTKAYAKVVAARPALRRAYFSFPWARLFEYSTTTADIAISAPVEGENAVVFAPLKAPQQMLLADIDRQLAWFKEAPVERLVRYRRALRMSRLARFLRRWIWWYHLNVSAKKRSRSVGTFGVSSMANWGVDSLRPIAPCTTLLHYGVIDTQGKVTVRLTFDHRVMDGVEPSLALGELERVLNDELLAELTTPVPLAA